MLQLPRSHKKGVTCISGILLSETDAMFASTSSDGIVNVWDVSFPSQPDGECCLHLLAKLHLWACHIPF